MLIATVALAVVATLSATLKLTKNEHVVDSVHRNVGVPMRFLPILAAFELAGAAGIVIGLWVEALGLAAALGLSLYFAGAILAHLRVRDAKGMAGPVFPLVLSIAVLAFHIAST